MKYRRYKAGTLVTGYDTTYGMWMRPRCKGHVWELVGRSERASWSDSGYVQAARCLHCGDDPLPPLSTTNWQEKASIDYLRRASLLVAKEVRRMKDLGRKLAKEINASDHN